jgi:hypothetical protein
MKLSRGATQALLFELESIGSGLFEAEAAIVGEVAVSSELALLTDMFIVTAGSATLFANAPMESDWDVGVCAVATARSSSLSTVPPPPTI